VHEVKKLEASNDRAPIGCLLFQLPSGESVPCSVEMIPSNSPVTPRICSTEVFAHAAASVFHYFKKELERETVTLANSPSRWKKFCAGSALSSRAGTLGKPPAEIVETTSAFRARIRRQPRTVLFPAPARRTSRPTPPVAARFALLRTARLRQATHRRAALSGRCEKLQDHIVEYPPRCLTAEPEQNDCAWWWNEYWQDAALPASGRRSAPILPRIGL